MLDKDAPFKLIGLSREAVMLPEAEYEISGFSDMCPGFRNNVIFPSGMILEDSGEVKIYYGAADSFICLATADISDLLSLCANLQ